jgi:CheY-like chemotaxis protein
LPHFVRFHLEELRMPSRIGDARIYQNRTDFSFALVVEGVADFRNSVMALLREHRWLVHGTSGAEEAFRLLAHIPYSLIVLDSELPGMGGVDFVRMLQNSRDWRAIRLVVITGSSSPSLQSQLGESGVFLASKSSWEIGLLEFLSAEEGVPREGVRSGPIGSRQPAPST